LNVKAVAVSYSVERMNNYMRKGYPSRKHFLVANRYLF